MNIVLAEIRDFKRLVLARIQPHETGLTIIGGDCAQGKTTTIDGILYGLLGGKYRPSSAKREGAIDNPYIHIELSNGIVIERKGKNSDLLVIDPTGKRRNQSFLDDFIDAFALDLRKFLSANDAERAKILLDILGIGDQLAALDARESTEYDLRTAIGRDRDRKKKAAEEMTEFPGLPSTPLSAAEIMTKQRAAIETNAANAAKREAARRARSEMTATIGRAKQDAERSVADAQRDYDGRVSDARRAVELLRENIERAKNKIAELTRQLDAAEKEKAREELHFDNAVNAEKSIRAENNVAELTEEKRIEVESLTVTLESNCAKLDAEAAATVDVDTMAFDAEIEAIEETNAKIRANKLRCETLTEARKFEADYDAKSRIIESIRTERIALLEGAKFPIAGAGIQNGVVHYKGKAWDCMSKAEQLMVATATARAKAPDFSTVCLDGGEAFDVKTLTKFGEWAEKQGLQIIMTRVSTGPECSIIVEDGIARANA